MKFTTYESDRIATSLDRKGVYTVDSEFRGVMYAIKGSAIVVFGGKNGILSVDVDQAETFLEELRGIVDLAKSRKAMQIKGA